MFELNMDENKRYSVWCSIDSNICMPNKRIKFLVDTGAPNTTCTADALSLFLKEEIFRECEISCFGGYIDAPDSAYAVHYKHTVRNFRAGEIDLGGQDIWLTFDHRVNENLLGMDIISKLTFLQLKNTNKLLFFKDIEDVINMLADIG